MLLVVRAFAEQWDVYGAEKQALTGGIVSQCEVGTVNSGCRIFGCEKATFLNLCATLLLALQHQNESCIDSGEASGNCTLAACNTRWLMVNGKSFCNWKIHSGAPSHANVQGY